MRDCKVSFEWILMERLPGTPLVELLRTMTPEAREAVIKSVAHFAAQLFRLRLPRIGNIYRASGFGAIARVAESSRECSNSRSCSASTDYAASALATTVPRSSTVASTLVTRYAVGQLVSTAFIWGARV